MKWYPFLEHTILDYLEDWKPLRFFAENYSDPYEVTSEVLRYHLRCLQDDGLITPNTHTTEGDPHTPNQMLVSTFMLTRKGHQFLQQLRTKGEKIIPTPGIPKRTPPKVFTIPLKFEQK